MSGLTLVQHGYACMFMLELCVTMFCIKVYFKWAVNASKHTQNST